MTNKPKEQRKTFADLRGKIIKEIAGGVGDDEMHFILSDGSVCRLYHWQDCCESVSVQDIAGDLSDLIGLPILQAEETSSDENPADFDPKEYGYQESFTWTFYRLGTRKGRVTIRWYGESNGYYSESVDCDWSKPK